MAETNKNKEPKLKNAQKGKILNPSGTNWATNAEQLFYDISKKFEDSFMETLNITQGLINSNYKSQSFKNYWKKMSAADRHEKSMKMQQLNNTSVDKIAGMKIVGDDEGNFNIVFTSKDKEE